MRVMSDLVKAIKEDGLTLATILREQQRYHEYRRWSVFDVFRDRKLKDIHPRDRAAIWHTARSELTTQPAGIRLAVSGVTLANEIRKDNPVGSIVLHAAAAWSARYWLEEEAHHEVAYNLLLEMMEMDPVPEDELIEHRGFFPDDNYARVCILQACVEVEAAVMYGAMANVALDPLVREIFGNIARDEVQHRQYFATFAQALVDSGVYPAKDVLAMAFTWIRPNAGETHGSHREQQTQREGFVNWWERTRHDENDDLAVDLAPLQATKERTILQVAATASRQDIGSFAELQRCYFQSLRTRKPAQPVA